MKTDFKEPNIPQSMNKDEIEKYLRKKARWARLTSKIHFEIIDDTLKVHVPSEGTVENMQDNGSAFESWIIILKAAFPSIANVMLDWDIPENNPAENPNYNCFVMRALNFKKAYPWFSVSENKKDTLEEMDALLKTKTIVVNSPKDEESKSSQNPNAEINIAKRLVCKLRSGDTVADGQLPMGLFKANAVSDLTSLTPKRHCAIDAWDLKEDTIRIHEVKKEGNKPAGIISQLMFYVCTVKNMADGYITYPDISDKKDYRNFKAVANAIADKKIKNIIGSLTVAELHNLIKGYKNEIVNILNNNEFGISFEINYISDLNI